MSDESFISSGKKMQEKVETNEKIALWSYVSFMEHNSPNECALKILWKSPTRHLASFAFPKMSPLLPFFNHAYKKLWETGTWWRLKKNWKEPNERKCNLKSHFHPISVQKIVSLLVMLLLAIAVSILILCVEKVSYYFEIRTSLLQTQTKHLVISKNRDSRTPIKYVHKIPPYRINPRKSHTTLPNISL